MEHSSIFYSWKGPLGTPPPEQSHIYWKRRLRYHWKCPTVFHLQSVVLWTDVPFWSPKVPIWAIGMPVNYPFSEHVVILFHWNGPFIDIDISSTLPPMKIYSNILKKNSIYKQYNFTNATSMTPICWVCLDTTIPRTRPLGDLQVDFLIPLVKHCNGQASPGSTRGQLPAPLYNTASGLSRNVWNPAWERR